MVRCYEFWDRSSAWLERRPVKAKVAGSSPVGPALESLSDEIGLEILMPSSKRSMRRERIVPKSRMLSCGGQRNSRHFVNITAWNGGSLEMFKELQKRFASTDSYVSLVLGIAVVLVIGVLVYNFIQSRGTQAPASSVPVTDEEKMATGTPGGTHTVAAGETLWSISEKYYKTGYNWVDLQSANNLTNADAIEEGQQLVIPTVTPIVPPGQVASGEAVMQPAAKTYTVVHGDTLWSIAVAQYGDGYKWSEIARANSLGNPDLIHAGNVLTLP